MKTKFLIAGCAIALISAVAGYCFHYMMESLSKDTVPIDITTIPKEKMCYRGGEWNVYSPTIPMDAFYQKLDHIAVFFDYGNGVNEAFACIEGQGEEECKNSKEAKINPRFFPSAVNAYNKYKAINEFILPKNLFEQAKAILEPTIGQCNGDTPVTLHYSGEDKVFKQRGTLGIKVKLYINQLTKDLRFIVTPFRVEYADFSQLDYLRSTEYEFNYEGKSPEEIQEFVKSTFRDRILRHF